MIVVSNTSPNVNLAVVGQLDLLQKLYGHVIIPQAVYDEIVIAGAGQTGAVEVKSFAWIETNKAKERALVASLQLELDNGEVEAIALAAELKADLLLLDERRGRAIASRLGLRCVGLLGVLMEAKHQDLIAAVKPILDALIQKAGFWVSQALYDHVLQSAGE
jgi:predicted nucleic acid-binding protein